MAATNGTTNGAPKYDLQKVVGFQYDDIPVSWNERDAILYALSIGAGVEDQTLVNGAEKTGFTVFPTFATTLSVKGTATNLQKFPPPASRSPGTNDGLPPLDPRTLIMGSQYIEVLKPIPTNADAKNGWKLKKWTGGVHENENGVSLDNEIHLIGDDGTPYVKLVSENRYIKAVANGTKFDFTLPDLPNIELAQEQRDALTQGPPTYTLQIDTAKNTPLLFRLNGDYNPLHVDPTAEITKTFGGVILHAISYYGLVARALLYKLGDNKPENLKRLYARFNPAGPVYPGDSLIVKVWEGGLNPDGTTALAFEAVNAKTGKLSLTSGVSHVIKGTVKDTPPVTATIAGSKPIAPTTAPGPVAAPASSLPTDVSLRSWIGIFAFGPFAIAFGIFDLIIGVLFSFFTPY